MEDVIEDAADAVAKRRLGLSGGAIIAAGACLLFFSASSAAVHQASVQAPIEGDPRNHKAMQAVCTGCHGAEMFSGTPRSWSRWTDIVQRMMRHGAQGTEEQIDGLVTYLLENLTLVNINTSPADELTMVLGVGENVSNAIVARRAQKKFSGLAELESFPGVDRDVLKRRSSRLQF